MSQSKASKVWTTEKDGTQIAGTRGGSLVLWSHECRGGFTLTNWIANTDIRTVARPLPSLRYLVLHPLEQTNE